MAAHSFISRLLCSILNSFLAVEENKNRDIGDLKKIIIIRQHNQLDEFLSGVSLFRALKETYPDSKITVLVGSFNFPGIVINNFIDRVFIFNKKKLYRPGYLIRLWRLLREDYDLAIVPFIVSISLISNLLARFSKAKVRIGTESVDGKINQSAEFFDRRVKLNWNKHPDSNVSERSLDIVRPFGINTNNYKPELSISQGDERNVEKFMAENNFGIDRKLIGLHVGGKNPSNCWSLAKYIALINRLNNEFQVNFYLVGSKSDKKEIHYLTNNLNIKLGIFINKLIPEIAALISKSSLFISNDTGIMHVAGTTETPQISIFGPTNPFNWAPLGPNKYFIRKSELIEDVAVEDVYQLCKMNL